MTNRIRIIAGVVLLFCGGGLIAAWPDLTRVVPGIILLMTGLAAIMFSRPRA